MPKINVYLPDDLAAAVKEAQVPVSAICQNALETAVRNVNAAGRVADAPIDEDSGLSPEAAFNRYTDRARAAIVAASTLAGVHGQNYVGTEHILLGIISEGTNLGVRVLGALDVEPSDVRDEVVASLGPKSVNADVQRPFTPLARAALVAATKEALGLGHNYIGCEHLLLGLLATEDGLANKVLRRMGVEPKAARRVVVAVLSGFVQGRDQMMPPAASDAADPSAPTLEDVVRRLDAIEQKLAE